MAFNEQQTLLQAGRFRLIGAPVACEPHGQGHINETYLVTTDSGQHYILQRLSRVAFQDIPALMQNISAVTGYLNERTPDPRQSLHLIPTLEGDSFRQDEAGEYWRMYEFIEHSICLQLPETGEDLVQCAVAFGRFQNLLRDFPSRTLHETIPDFHNTPDRFRKLHRAIDLDPCGRKKAVEPEIDFWLEREREAGLLQRMREEGSLPLRVTHNDTKINNVMLDADTRAALCVIDLDTVMPGLVAYDFGDSIRFGASTAAEDEQDLSKVEMSLALYESYVRGFLPACGELTVEEIRTLPLGARLMTLECGIRFLTDYLEGDRYFHTAYPEHNLVRARTQQKLVADMERKQADMQRIVEAWM